jgi:hypothetical protein
MSSTIQISKSKPININENQKYSYTINNECFDPFQQSPPNVFMNHLKFRIKRFDNIDTEMKNNDNMNIIKNAPSIKIQKQQ